MPQRMTRMMTLMNDLDWAIHPESLEGMLAILESKIEDGKIDASLFGGAEDHSSYKVTEDGVAIIPITGTLSKRFYMFSCGTTFDGIKSMVSQALEDESVSAIMLDIDSPGGTVAGTAELADYLHSVRDQKPLYAYADGLMASAAYWIGSVAQKIAAPSTAQVGSIGVVTAHVETSMADNMRGIKRTVLTAGKYKAAGNDTEPLDPEAKAYILDRLNSIYDLFKAAVARNRGVSIKAVDKMADGKVFLAGEALNVGAIDLVVSGKDEFLAMISKEIEKMPMNYDTLKAEHQDLFDKVKAEGKAEAEEVAKVQKEQAQEGILALVKAAFGEDVHAKLGGLMEAGVTAEQVNAMKDLLPQKVEAGGAGAQKEILEQLKADAEDPFESVKPDKAEAPKDFLSEVDRLVKAEGISKTAAMTKVMDSHPELHEAYIKSLSERS